MTSLHHVNNKLKRQFIDIQELIKKQEKLLGEMNEVMNTKDDYVINLETTVRNLIEHGLSKDEILEITGTTPERYEGIVADRKYYNIPYIYLNEDETMEYEQLLREIHHSNNMDELINPFKEQQRINFIHKVLLRYKKEFDGLTKLKNSDNYEKLILNYIDRTGKDKDAERAYSILVRRFGNEMKRMREKVLVKFSE
ncbi:hypothetical protein J7I80_21285 [Bacillus sp. ISL-41]|uniref:hypothetical protein n=1 Tax=Bacillus sp. ISL-41 TaxID=2819127 RepID=UPI001BE84B35|nr:hypothetical protein [Bacillus sp. ISL-41]MBT2644756.1 hypothetical protein [Bacillus sp. ISL-41]